MAKEKWVIEFTEDKQKFNFSRFLDEKIDEQYVSCPKEVASVWAVSIVNGFRPPKLMLKEVDDLPIGSEKKYV